VIEILRFRLLEGAEEAAFLVADDRVQTEFAYQQPGLLRRTVARSADGEWVVVDIWDSAEAADAGEAEWAKDAATAELMSFVDGTSVVSTRYSERS
jgi:heme-degrading monooxygenase HmoA